MSDAHDDHDPPLTVVTPRRPGRPPSDVPMTSLSVWVPVTTADKICALSQRHGRSVSSIVRALLELRLSK